MTNSHRNIHKLNSPALMSLILNCKMIAAQVQVQNRAIHQGAINKKICPKRIQPCRNSVCLSLRLLRHKLLPRSRRGVSADRPQDLGWVLQGTTVTDFSSHRAKQRPHFRESWWSTTSCSTSRRWWLNWRSLGLILTVTSRKLLMVYRLSKESRTKGLRITSTSFSWTATCLKWMAIKQQNALEKYAMPMEFLSQIFLL